MADIQHATLSDDRLHYPKGATLAAADTWLRAAGDSTTSFALLPTYTPTISDTLIGISTVAQTLVAADDEAAISFGGASVSSNGHISLAADGTITFNTAGVYHIQIGKNVSRSTITASDSIAFCNRRAGVQYNDTEIIHLDNIVAGYTVDTTTIIMDEFAIGQSITTHMLYLSGTSGNIGLGTLAVADANWADVPSASIIVSKLEV